MYQTLNTHWRTSHFSPPTSQPPQTGTEDMLGFTKGQAKDHLTSIPTTSSNKPKNPQNTKNAKNSKNNKNGKNGKKGREADAEEWTGFTIDD